MARPIYLTFLLSLFLVFESSCHKKQVKIASPPPPAPSVPAPEPTLPAPPSLEPAAPPASVPTPEPAPALPPPSATQNPPSNQSRPRRPRPSTAPQAAPQPAPASPATPPPQLGPVLTADQQRQYNTALDQSLKHAQASIRSIGNRQLTKEQQASVQEIQNFIRQAIATRASDLPGAKSLAERAELLAKNLEKSLR